jgi:hypothetical protein
MSRFTRGTPWVARRGLRAAAAVAAAALVAGGVALAGAGSASANVAGYRQLNVLSSGYSLDVVGASTSPFAQIDVWYNNGNANQWFSFPQGNGQVGEIQNQNSGMCITTDDVPGDALYQFPCENGADQQWEAETSTVWWDPDQVQYTFLNPASGLVMDVYGNSYSPGATVDAWYPNGGYNQDFTLYGCYGGCS